MRPPRRVHGPVAAGALLTALLCPALSPRAQAQTPRPGEAAFRELYRELVEINTTLSVGSCTAAAEAMATRLKAAGLPASDLQILVPAGRPKDGTGSGLARRSWPRCRPAPPTAGS